MGAGAGGEMEFGVEVVVEFGFWIHDGVMAWGDACYSKAMMIFSFLSCSSTSTSVPRAPGLFG